ncbi:FG-GAP repeat domain-containing protein [Elongatibacter sediminis]|uniref:VCBS repeat-containing protein n=1 Tax=Elongatibacter sediminis TaxID=3119006 RepID=A0AAW9RHE5_9GAMM
MRRNRMIQWRFFTLLASVPMAMAQAAEYRDVSDTHLPPDLPRTCMDAAAADVDGDGDIDIALANEREANILLINDGQGRFASDPDRIPQTPHDSEDTTFADVNGDGHPDLLFASEDSKDNELYLNDGSGRFRNASENLPLKGRSNAIDVVDLNGDGALDIVLGNYGAEGVMINDGRGHFSDQTESYWPNTGGDTQDVELADLDGDGDLDAVLADEGPNLLYFNENGRLLAAPPGHLPVRHDESREFRAADADGDGDQDLLLVNINIEFTGPKDTLLFINDGSGRFSVAPSEDFPAGDREFFTVQVADVDTDGDLDAILPSSMFDPDTGDYLVYLNDGSGRFSLAAAGSILPESVNDRGIGFDIQVADFDGDGQEDLFFCNRAIPRTDPLVGGQSSLLLRGGAG